MPRWNLLPSFLLLLSCIILLNCGDHSDPEVSESTGGTPLINITDGPYEVIVEKQLIVGVETKFATKEPIYTAIPAPTGIAIVNEILEGRIVITGLKPGTTIFTIADQANPTAIARTISVVVNEKPSLAITPDPLTGIIGQSILLSITTLNPENEAQHEITISDQSIGRIIDTVNNPNLIDLLSAGSTNVTVKDLANDLTQTIKLTVTAKP